MKKLTFLLISLFVTLLSFAGEITEEQALQKAQQFMQGKKFKQNNSRRAASTTNKAYYVFNAENNEGFVIVSSDDRTEDILGYSEKGNIDLNNLPDNVKWWLGEYQKQIETIKANPQQTSIHRAPASRVAIAPLIKTTWGQHAPYNLQCPMDGDYRSVTGCVATAMAQLMYYYHNPTTCSSIPEYTTYTKGFVLSELESVSFSWNKMKTSYSSNETGDAADAVSTLMRYCGQSVFMDYSNTASSASAYEASEAFARYFGYNKNLYVLSRSSYQNDKWEDIIYQELYERRPILYCGANNDAGHAFLLDGYDKDNELYHINWGWNGDCDGFFLLSLLSPYNSGLDTGIGSNGYVINQIALIGLKPSEPDESMFPLLESYYVEQTDKYISRTHYDGNEHYFQGIVRSSYPIAPLTDLVVDLGWGLFQNDQFIDHVGYQTRTISEQYSILDNGIELNFDESLPCGNYQLMQIYRWQGTEDWHQCKGASAQSLNVEINADEIEIRSLSSDSPHPDDGISILGYPEVGSKINIRVKVSKPGNTNSLVVKLWLCNSDGSNPVLIGKTQLYYNSEDEEQSAWFSYTPTESGSFRLYCTDEDEDRQLLIPESFSVAPKTEIIVDGLRYAYNSWNGTAKILGAANSNLGHIVIPSFMRYNDQPYSVRAIEDGAFDGYNVPVEIEKDFCGYIGNYAFRSCIIKTLYGAGYIGNYAFSNCSLQGITISERCLSIGQHAFEGNDDLSVIILDKNSRFGIKDNVFDNYSATLYVNEGMKSVFQTTLGWKNFQNIVGANLSEVPMLKVSIGENNFPDEEFRNYILSEIEYGNDGVLTDTEISNIKDIKLYHKSIESLQGIEFFSALEQLECENNLLTDIDVSKNSKLQTLICGYNFLKTLDLSKNMELLDVSCNQNRLTSISVPKHSKLYKIEFNNNKVESFDASDCETLNEIRCNNNKLTSLNVRGCTALEHLSCGENLLNTLDLSDCSKLTELDCFNNKLSSLNSSNLKNLYYICCSDNLLETLDLSNSKKLSSIKCSGNLLNNLILSNNKSLERLECFNNNLSSLDLSNCLKLTSLSVYDNQIYGEAMDLFIENLPEPPYECMLFIVDLTSGVNERNSCTKDQVAALKAKGWEARSRIGSYFPIYEGESPKVSTPQITHEGDVITITTATPNASIYYTLDGTDPTEESQVYTEPFTVTDNCTITAIAKRDGYYDSEISSLMVDWIVVGTPCGYAIFDSSTSTLTFKYGVKPAGNNVWETENTAFTSTNGAPWDILKPKKAVFDASYAQARPKSTAYWFYDNDVNIYLDESPVSQLKEITGIEYLNTSDVTDMRYMFANCNSLTNIDVSHFDTRKVTDMEDMFYNCSSLTTIDVSNFETGNVTTMWGMFNYCSSLTSIDLSHFNTQKVIHLSSLFAACSSLKSIDLSSFETGQVTKMWLMFAGCSSLTSLDLSNFDTKNVLDMGGMFRDCSNLTTINVGGKWSIERVTNDEDMFAECTKLVGGEGTKYNSSYTDKTYARVDGGTSNPGYLTMDKSHETCGYAIFDSSTGTLTFKYGVKPAGSNVFETEDTGDNPAWDRSDLKTVIFDASYAQARPRSTARWFSILPDGGFIVERSKLEKIQGLEYLNTSKVVNMHNMFKNCDVLTSLDLSHFDTSIVLDMSYMFANCNNLKNLDLSSFNTSSVTTMEYMFFGCNNLKDLNISSFNTENVTNMRSLFFDCDHLLSLDVSNFNTEKVTDMSSMFGALEQVSTLDVSNFNTSNVTSMNSMFQSCYRLKTIDVSNFDTGNVIDMSDMFCFCSDLTTLDLSTFNTQNLKLMKQMFSTSENLKTLNISSFNTAKVEDMSFAFHSCLNLTTIYVGEGWSTENVTNDERMLDYCFNLVGGKGTTYNSSHIDKTYARIDGGTSAPGYFTEKPYILGDADGDGTVDVNDVTTTINHILGKPVANFVREAANIDGDESIDVNDVQGIIDIALGKRK